METDIYFTICSRTSKITGGYQRMVVSGSALKRLRLEAGLTQRQLAELAEVSQAHIAKIEKEKVDPRLSTVNRILQVLTEREGKKCGEIMSRHVISIKPADKVSKASRLMMKHAISQLPVLEGGKIVGTITEDSIVRNLSTTLADERIERIMQAPLPSVPEETSVSMIQPLLQDHPAVLIIRRGEIVGIIARSDLLKVISKAL
jgi:predicted transcriptional regulator